MSWIDGYDNFENWLNGWTVIQGVVDIYRFLPEEEIRKIVDVPSCFGLSSWIDCYIVCGNQLNGWKVIDGVIFHKKSPVAPQVWNLEF
jgi:hypothetical protein